VVLRRLLRPAGRAVDAAAALAGTAAGLALGSATLTAGLAAGTARAGARAVRATTRTSSEIVTDSARVAAAAGAETARLAGFVLRGADPSTTGGPDRIETAARAMFDPDPAPQRPRVWSDGGHAHVEFAAPDGADGSQVGASLRRRLERLDGVDRAAVNDVVGRVLVAFDRRRVGVDDVVGVVAAAARAGGGRQVHRRREEHPADLEPLLEAVASLLVNGTAAGAAYVGRMLPVPRLTRHATAVLTLVDSRPQLRRALTARLGPLGADLVLVELNALLHVLTQSPTVPAINAVAAAQRVVEVAARRAVWQRREPQLCRPEFERADAPAPPPAPRPVPLPPGPVESYLDRLAPGTLAGAAGLLALTWQPSRSADLLKGLSPKAALLGREAFASVLDLLLCRRGVLPMDGSAYRRLDRVGAVVLDGDVLCTGPPVVVEAGADVGVGAEGWDDDHVGVAATRLLDGSGGDGLQLAGLPPDAPGGRRYRVLDRGVAVGTVTVAPELDPLAEPLLDAARTAGHRVVLTDHVGVRDLVALADEVAPPGETLAESVRRLQADGHGVLAVSARDGPGLLAADVGVAPTRPDRPPAWGADLVTGAGLGESCRIVAATATARALSRRVVNTGLTGNALGALLAAVGSPRYGQRSATTPGKTATAVTMVIGTWTALRLDAQPLPPPSRHTAWHAMEPEQVLRRLAEAPPEPADRRPSPLRRFAALPGVALPARYVRTVAAELADPLTPVLGTGAAATALLGEATDAVLVGGVTVANALLSGLQQLRAETAIESLLQEQALVAHRETEGGREDVSAARLRAGDVLLLGPGDVVPADARLLGALDLEVDESVLTGESLAVAKAVPATPGAELADRTCMVFEGTTVVAGTGRAVVVAVGRDTQAGRAAAAAAGAAPPPGVQARLAELTRAVLPLTLAGGAAVTALGVLWRRPLRDAVVSGVAVAVAAVPEGLPLVATVAQLAAARRLTRRGVVVRSARVLEALGRVDTLCFDKTGTLTENRLRVARLVPLAADVDDDELLRLAVTAAGRGDERAHETDRAVAEAAAERGVALAEEPDAELGFTAGRGFSATARAGRLVVKGAPEVVLARCADTGRAAETVRGLAADGLRVLAVADRDLPDDVPGDLDAAACGLTPRGLVALADTVRPAAAGTVARLRAAGVRVLVVTGDHPQTAAAIAAQAGVPDADRVVTGARFARASDAERTRLVREAAVFARVSPEQKVSIVGALRRAGATLAMTGDGVNDAAAIRLADVGIGVPGPESPAARRSADLVLTDPDLGRLVDAIGEGRAMWSRVRDAVSVLVGGNAGEVAFTVLGAALGGRSPLGTRQLLLVNLLTDMFPALAMAVAAPRHPPAYGGTGVDGPLAGHPQEPELLAGPQHDFRAAVRRMMVVRGTATAAGATGAWVVGRISGTRRRAGTMGLAALITTQLGQTAWAGRRSPLVLVTAAASGAALAAVVQTPGVNRFFGCTALDPLAWLVVLGWAAAATAGAELVPRA